MRCVPLLSFAVSAIVGCSGCVREEILHGLDERQANEVLVALDERGLSASKAREEGSEGRWRIDVRRADAASAQRILAERDLPRSRPPGFDEVFAKGSMVPTPTEEHALYLHALGGELARSIEAIDGIVEARVHLGLRQPDPLRPSDRAAPRGAVLVKCRPAACGAVRALEAGIRSIVAGAVDGLDAGAVSIVVTNAAESTRVPPEPARRGTALLLLLAAVAAIAAIALAIAALRSRFRGEATS
jgi:type III secretion protein J